jgi:histidinol phosphatase-like enzyme (inositol monophosphatase family)
MPAPDESLASLLACAHRLADISAAAILPYFRQDIAVEDKGEGGQRGFDPVTAADTAAERVMRDELARVYPAHAIAGEEMADKAGRTDRRWIIDPIDGTRAFIMGYPLWGTLIGLADGKTPLLGLMNQPFTGERFWSEDGHAFWRRHGQDQRRLTTRKGVALKDAILTATTPDMFKSGEETQRFERIRSQVRLTRFGGDCYSYAMVAMGLVDVVVEASLKPFDIAALIPIIEGAGGRVTGWDGGPALEGGRVVASGDPHLHDSVLEILAR